MRIISEKASKRIANHAFTIASQRKMKKVTCVHKSNVMKKTDGLFARTCSKVAMIFLILNLKRCMLMHVQ